MRATAIVESDISNAPTAMGNTNQIGAGAPGARGTAKNSVRTRQFWLLWVVLFCNVTASIGILEQAAPMIQDYFRKLLDSQGGRAP